MAATVLITGASQGIGRATARLFAERGCGVVLAARTTERLKQVAETIRASGGKALAIPTDVTDRQQVAALAEQAIATYGRVDVLVNNAGICMTAAMADTELRDWQQVLNVNLWGYINTIRAMLPHFLERGSGAIVNVGSVGSKVPLPGMTAYCTSKYAVAGLSETLRLELAPCGIEVCAVHPSVTNSDFLERAIFRGDPDALRQQMQTTLQSPIASQPEDVARAIWNVVQHPQPEVAVGSAAIAKTLYRLAPGLTQWLMRLRN
ncbi:short-chain alcohol dehydrogenase of unknown specificity [Rubidibacter lacunae KORDI 51-2]|uniref:Ketoreductase domain-containing protein n=1 Tax=Rubidibacter lacunae KORDI 51-2 TaxID=582515 RepID=U5DJA3_9CHRO|nr:SDR family oxidoreductase [Rubidibacter lacunae]ERN41012.1 short-chain alcohol dehydrogenase of unknown specificity [Rubidibacter lacunae KORDI 51-2]